MATKASKKAATSGVKLDVLKGKRANYVVTKVDKRRLIDNGDPIATKLRGLDLDATYALCSKETETPEKELRERYQHLNPGMQRMNLGNKLRGGKKEPKAPKKAKAPKAAKKASTKKVTPKAPVDASAAA